MLCGGAGTNLKLRTLSQLEDDRGEFDGFGAGTKDDKDALQNKLIVARFPSLPDRVWPKPPKNLPRSFI